MHIIQVGRRQVHNRPDTGVKLSTEIKYSKTDTIFISKLKQELLTKAYYNINEFIDN